MHIYITYSDDLHIAYTYIASFMLFSDIFIYFLILLNWLLTL